MNLTSIAAKPLSFAAFVATVSCVVAAAEMDVPPVAQAASTRIVVLGTRGGPVPAATRAQPANAVVVGDHVYLVDAGNGVVRQLVLAHLDYRRVDHIFITHNHDDHNADWGTLMGLQWSTGRATPVHVYGPVGTQTMLKGFLQYFEPNAQIRGAEVKRGTAPGDMFRAHDITGGGLIFQDDRVKVSATEVCHYHFDPNSPPHGGPHKSFAFRFETSDKVVVFSGDTGKCASLADFARDADLLVHEVVSLPLIADSLRRLMASQRGPVPPSVFQDLMRHMTEDHSTPEDIGKLAAEAHVKKVVLTHFVPGDDSDPDDAYTDGVRKYFSGPVTAAHDLMTF